MFQPIMSGLIGASRLQLSASYHKLIRDALDGKEPITFVAVEALQTESTPPEILYHVLAFDCGIDELTLRKVLSEVCSIRREYHRDIELKCIRAIAIDDIFTPLMEHQRTMKLMFDEFNPSNATDDEIVEYRNKVVANRRIAYDIVFNHPASVNVDVVDKDDDDDC